MYSQQKIWHLLTIKNCVQFPLALFGWIILSLHCCVNLQANARLVTVIYWSQRHTPSLHPQREQASHIWSVLSWDTVFTPTVNGAQRVTGITIVYILDTQICFIASPFVVLKVCFTQKRKSAVNLFTLIPSKMYIKWLFFFSRIVKIYFSWTSVSC